MQVTVREKTYEPLPPGTYKLWAKDCTVQSNKGTGEDFLSWQLEVIDEDSPEFERVFSYGAPISPGKKSKHMDFYRACGLNDSTIEGDFAIDTDHYLNIPFYAEVTIENNKKGEPSNRIKWFKSVADFEAAARRALGLDKVAQRPPAPAAVPRPAAPATPVAAPVAPVARPVAPVARPVARPVAPVTPAAQEEEEGALDFPPQ